VGKIPNTCSMTKADRQDYIGNVLRYDTVFTRAERLERGCPLLAVETEVNGDSKNTNEKSLSLVGSLRLSCQYKRFLFCLGCSIVGSLQNIFFLTVLSISILLSLAQQAGQAAVLGRLSLCTVQYVSLVLAVYSGFQNAPSRVV
jgi:hypothetical protein